MKRIHLILILLSFTLINHAQNKTIKFHFDRMINPRIILDNYEIKGVKMKLLYDTGSVGSNMLTYNRAKEIGLFLSNDSTYIQTLGGSMKQRYTTNLYYDPIFGPFVSAAHPDDFLSLTEEPIDGFVGYSDQGNCIEFNFQKKELCFYDTVPQFYIANSKVRTTFLVNGDTGYEGEHPHAFNDLFYIQGFISIADSIKVKTNFLLDTGMSTYSFMTIQDSLLLSKATNYKAIMKSKYGDNYPTIRLEVPELSIDTLMTNTRILPTLGKESLSKPTFGNSPIGGFLGIEFFREYTRILFDCKNRKAYFLKE